MTEIDQPEEIKFNKIYHEDCFTGLKKLQSSSAQCIMADPPYNVGKNFGNNQIKLTNKQYVEWSKKWIKECKRILKGNGTMFIFGYSEILPYLTVYIQDELDMNVRPLIWHYTNRTVPSLKFWQRSHEAILCCWKGKSRPKFNRDNVRVPYTATFLKNSAGKTRKTTKGRFGVKETTYNAHDKGALPRDVIKFPCLAGGAGKRERVNHPTQKPLKLCTYLLKSCQQKDGIVVAPFAGSGTECMVAKALKIDFVGFEINKDYIEIANKRLSELVVDVNKELKKDDKKEELNIPLH
jgi:site-specific DNA-methyltransferase (adenine-specific)